MPLLFSAALLTIYIVLGILYESFIHPITILSTLFSASVGAALALRLFDTQFTVIAAIGVLLLIGIVKKNAIMMIDFALAAERGGLDTRQAIEQACLVRFRPIMMTTCAAIFGALPLTFGAGEGSELRHPLGITTSAACSSVRPLRCIRRRWCSFISMRSENGSGDSEIDIICASTQRGSPACDS